jgi:hypothetical protein
VIGALDFGGNALIHGVRIPAPSKLRTSSDSLTGYSPPATVCPRSSFRTMPASITVSARRPRQRRLLEHKVILLHLPAYSAELNMIEIVRRHLTYRWRFASPGHATPSMPNSPDCGPHRAPHFKQFPREYLLITIVDVNLLLIFVSIVRSFINRRLV